MYQGVSNAPRKKLHKTNNSTALLYLQVKTMPIPFLLYFTAQVCSSYMLMLSDSITEVSKLFQSMTALQWKEGMPVHVAKYLNEVV